MEGRKKWGKRLERFGGGLLLWSAMRSDGGAPLWEALVFGGAGCILLLLGAALSRPRPGTAAVAERERSAGAQPVPHRRAA